MYKDFFEKLIEVLVSLGFNCIEDDFPLKVSVEQLKYPVAIVTNNSAIGISTTGYVELNISISLLWPGLPYRNYLVAINQAQGIASSLKVRDYMVTPISHKSPDVSGGLVTISIKTNVKQICPPSLDKLGSN